MFQYISHEVWGKVWGNVRGNERFGGGMGNLTATGLRNLREAGRFSDGGGLILFRNKSGKASWIVRVQANGRRRDVGIGSYPDISLADARELAASVRKLAVRRQNIWHNSRRRLTECGPRLRLMFRRRACDVASADVRASVA